MKFNTMWLLIISAGVFAGMLVGVNFFLFRQVENIFSVINVMAGFIFVLPIILYKYNQHNAIKHLEELFPVFLRDFVEAIRGGMTVPQAFNTIQKNDYKSLNPFIKKMAAQMDWGVPVDKVLLRFAKNSKSKLIARVVSSVVESHRFGGNLADTFDALSNTSLEVDRLRQERKLYLSSQMMTGYIVFFVFLSVIIGLQKFLVPSLAQVSGEDIGLSGLGGATNPNIAAEYSAIFRNLILLQGGFAGLAVGKMSEGSTVSGLKHSMFMMVIGFLVFTLANVFT
ncbi:MAG: type II secretion system F family protein [Candidatus Aenigmarchaeota archaeon]|nr:type II secretion system F family protein [Candidatus Aenigmarchaeota archaeon]